MRKFLACLSLLALTLVGCANAPSKQSAPPGDALPALLAALQKTSDAGSARMAMDLTFTTPEQTIHVTGDVEYEMDPGDPTSLRERMLLQIPSLGMVPGGKIEIVVGKRLVIYVRAPMIAAYVPAPTPWIKIDPSTLPQGSEGLAGATAAANPAAVLAAIKESLTVDEVGPDTVAGSDATHYRATVDIVKLLPLLADLAQHHPTDAEMQKAEDELENVGMEKLPVDLWLDESGFLKRLQLTLDLTGLEPTRPTSFSLTLTFSDIGQHISIEVPPASQVTDIGDLIGSAFASTASAA